MITFGCWHANSSISILLSRCSVQIQNICNKKKVQDGRESSTESLSVERGQGREIEMINVRVRAVRFGGGAHIAIIADIITICIVL